MKTIPFGFLPTRSGLATLGDLQGVSVDSLLRVMRASLQRHGPNEGLRELLRAVAFDWAPQSPSDLDLDVSAVAEALSFATPVADASHPATEPAAPTGDTTTAGVANVLQHEGDNGSPDADLALAATVETAGLW